MKGILLFSGNYYRNKGLLGISLKKLTKTRGGDDLFKVQNVELVDKDTSRKSKIS